MSLLMRRISATALVGMSLLTVNGSLSAQEAKRDAARVERGHAIADKVCWVCHVIGPDQEFSPVLKEPGPDFRQIAKRSDTTVESLTAFLHTAHRAEDKPYAMPNPGLDDESIDAVANYILSLRPRS